MLTATKQEFGLPADADGLASMIELKRAGYADPEIGAWQRDTTQTLRDGGFSQGAINTFFGHAPFDPVRVKRLGEQGIAAGPKPPTSFLEALESGYGWSTWKLGAKATGAESGGLPETRINEDSPWYYRGASNLAALFGDIPAMVAGASLGGGPVTGFAGAVALPAALRAVFIHSIEQGQVQTAQEFAELAAHTMWETVKGYAVGATAGLAGKAASAVLPASAPKLIQTGVPAAAELATMATVSAGLEGQLPKVSDFEDLAVVLAGGKAAVAVARQARRMYERTGVPPSRVVEDAVNDPQVWQDALDGRVPQKYADKVTRPPTPPTQREVVEELQAAPSPEAGAAPDPALTVKAQAFYEQPFADVPQGPHEPTRPTHTNYNYVDTPEDIQQALSRLSTLYEEKIQTERKGTQSWAESHREAAAVLSDLVGQPVEKIEAFIKGQPASASTTAQLLARKELALSAAEDVMRQRAALKLKGADATPEDLALFLAQVERTSTILASFLGQRADTARAMNALKSTRRTAEKAQDILDVIQGYGGDKNITLMVDMLGELHDPRQVLALAPEFTKLTSWEKIVTTWKALLVSGFRTHEVNVLSSLAFTALRVPVETVTAAIGRLRVGAETDPREASHERAYFAEIPARIEGMLRGAFDGARIRDAMDRLDVGEGGKAEAPHKGPVFPGVIGKVVDAPFVALRAEDAWNYSINSMGEVYAYATRRAIREQTFLGYDSPEFKARIKELIEHPEPDLIEAMKTAGERYTFNAPLGPTGRTFKRFVSEAHLEWLFPFIRTPGNIFKETARMTPGMNFAVREWRKDYEAGGVRRDRALAEIGVGAAIMAAVMTGAFQGAITGGGSPDRGQRPTDRAAGWSPYAVKIGDHFYSGYNRLAPIGNLAGLAADASEIWQYMTTGEREHLSKMLGYAFSQGVTNQTFMRGATNFVLMLSDPERYGATYFEQLESTVVPGLLGQTAAELDPLQREIHGFLQAVQARVPLWREGLMPKRDLFGEVIPRPESLWIPFSPFSVTTVSPDKVRTEASRLGFATPLVPKTLDVLPGIEGEGTDLHVMTDAERDVFTTTAGKLAHEVLSEVVRGEAWDRMPDMLKRQQYETVFATTRAIASIEALTAEDRTQAVEDALVKLKKELTFLAK